MNDASLSPGINVIRLGHSPDPDDAFMFYGLARGRIDTEGLRFEHRLEDIETLNQRAFRGELEVTALSLNAYAHLSDRYTLLNTGASMGVGYGPMVIAREPLVPEALAGRTIAVPGEYTTAFLTLRMFMGEFDYEVVPFDRIFQAVQDGAADAGLIIHEGQLTYEREGFHCVVDLGKWWVETHGGLPLPLGVNGVRTDLGPALCRRIDRVLRRSIDYSLAHRAEAVQYALQWGRGLDAALADRFIGMYVNEWTTDTGGRGHAAIERYLAEATAKSLIPDTCKLAFVE
ncbi:MAG: ABC transporter substrate-binding protein [bacterium]|nr:ABC transporter substrate-binding protein [bacterium]